MIFENLLHNKIYRNQTQTISTKLFKTHQKKLVYVVALLKGTEFI